LDLVSPASNSSGVWKLKSCAIQRVSDVDEFREEAYLTVAGRMILVRASLDEVRGVLADAAQKTDR
jgi:hypothetical protein